MKRIITFIGLLMALRSAGSTWVPPIGIPNPLWGRLHPIDKVTPTKPAAWPSASVSGNYFIDSSHVAATDTANSYGYPDKPRLTVPSTLAAGSKVWIDFLKTGATLSAATGTEANPIWIIGNGKKMVKPIAASKCITISGTSSYIFVDDVTFDGSDIPAGLVGGGFSVGSGVNHIAFRNVTVSNFGAAPFSEAKGTAAVFSSLNSIVADTADVTDIVMHRLVVVGNAGGQNMDYETGRHAVHAYGPKVDGFAVRRVWLMDSTLVNNAEDGVQIGRSSLGDSRLAVDHFYIGRCVINNNGENAVDLKACNRIVISQNAFAGYKPTSYRSGAVSGSDGVSCVINDDGGGPLESWWIFNRFSNCRGGIRNQATISNHYVIGNIVNDMFLLPGDVMANGSAKGTFYHCSNQGSSSTLLNNTVFDVEGGFYLNNGKNWTQRGNIVHGIRTVGYPVVRVNVIGTVNIGENIYFDDNATIRQDGNALDISDLKNVDPSLVDPSKGVFSLREVSPARNLLTSIPEAYATYEATFGVSIKFDFDGNARPADAPWDAGAIQCTEAAKRPGKPGGLSVTPIPKE